MSGVVMKVVKVSPGFMDPKIIERAIENSLTQTAKAIKVDFGVTTRTWSKRPDFKITRGRGVRSIFTDDPIYGLVDDGAKPHIIRPKRAKRLSFQGNYRAKSRVRVIGSSSGGKSGATVTALSVKHPGFKGREFAETIAKKWVKLYPKQFNRALAAALSK